MIYEKQNFKDGQVLTAEQMNHMEDGISKSVRAYKETTRNKIIEGTKNFSSNLISVSVVDADGNNFVLKEGTQYILTVDGVEYVKTAQVDPDATPIAYYISTDDLPRSNSTGFYVHTSNVESEDASTHLGVGFVAADDYRCEHSYILEEVVEVVNRIDPDLLPAGVGVGGAFIVNVTEADDGTISADKTFAEISAAIEAGQSIVCREDAGYMVTYFNLYTYGAGQAIGFNTVQMIPSDYTTQTLDTFIYGVLTCTASDTWAENNFSGKLAVS